MLLFFDTETTGLPLWHEPSDDPRQPHIVQIAALLCKEDGEEVDSFVSVVNPGVDIPAEVAAIHGISNERARAEGVEPAVAMGAFGRLLAPAALIIGHNVSFDVRLVRIAHTRVYGSKWEPAVPTFCTMKPATPIVKAMHANPRHDRDYKWPKLAECIRHFFDEELEGAHDALVDVRACKRVYFKLRELGIQPGRA